MSDLAPALQRAMAARGLTIPDLARDTGLATSTVRTAVTGRTRKPTRTVRDALDDYFTPGQRGITLDIAEGRVTDYPSDDIAEAVRLIQQLSPSARRLLIELLRELTRPVDPPTPPARRRR